MNGAEQQHKHQPSSYGWGCIYSFGHPSFYLQGNAPAKKQTENGVEFSFDEHVMKKTHLMIQSRQQHRPGCMGIFAVPAKAVQVGDKNAEDGKSAEYIHESFSFVGLNRIQRLHKQRFGEMEQGKYE